MRRDEITAHVRAMGLDRAAVLLAVAMLLLGIAIGGVGTQFRFAAFLEDRADDGVPVSAGGHLYRVTDVTPRGLDVSEVWGDDIGSGTLQDI